MKTPKNERYLDIVFMIKASRDGASTGSKVRLFDSLLV